MSFLKRREFSVALVFIFGTFMILSYFIDIPAAADASDTLLVWATLTLSFAMPIGAIHILRSHGMKIYRKTRNYGFSVILIVTLFLTAAAGLIGGQTNPIYLFFGDAYYWPLGATMYATTAFYMLSASFTAVRARNFKASLLVIPVVLVMIANAPIAGGIPILPDLGRWFLKVQGVSVTRGVRIGTTLSVLALGLRTILGYETSVLGILKEEE